MDPLHPLVPIQPPAPTPPTYARVERVDRDGQREAHPEWQSPRDDDADGDEQNRFEDEYDPDWADPTVAEPYGPDGSRQEAASVDEPEAGAERRWDPRRDGERRSRPRPSPGQAGQAGRDGSDGSGTHIDISA